MTAQKRRLGRGLNSLLSTTRLRELDTVAAMPPVSSPVHVADRGQVIDKIAVDAIHRNPHQPRQQWNDKALYELAQSIKSNGLVQPITVRPMGTGYQLIAGERRLRAAKLIGMTTISAIVRDASEEQMLEWALVENIHRTDLNALERARAYEHYITTFSLKQEEAAERLGEDRSTVANYLRLLELSGEVREMLGDGRISMGHARALLGLVDSAERERLARMVVARKVSVRELERLVKGRASKQAKTTPEDDGRRAHIMELEEELRSALGTKVTIKTAGANAQRGRITIEFYSLDDFDRIRKKLT